MSSTNDKDAMRATRALVALGTNLPHAGPHGRLAGAELLAAALREMANEGLIPVCVSSAWGSPAWPAGMGQPDFVNAVAEVETGGRAPEAVLALLLAIERRFGRVRGGERWAARTLDLDLIAQTGPAGDIVRDAPDPVLPHPRAHVRAFVLAPLAEIAADWRHPVLALTASQLLIRVLAKETAPVRLGPVSI